MILVAAYCLPLVFIYSVHAQRHAGSAAGRRAGRNPHRIPPALYPVNRELPLRNRDRVDHSVRNMVRLFVPDRPAYFGGLTRTRSASVETEPLVMREIDTRFTFVVSPPAAKTRPARGQETGLRQPTIDLGALDAATAAAVANRTGNITPARLTALLVRGADVGAVNHAIVVDMIERA